jgi:hypothetical protein
LDFSTLPDFRRDNQFSRLRHADPPIKVGDFFDARS